MAGRGAHYAPLLALLLALVGQANAASVITSVNATYRTPPGFTPSSTFGTAMTVLGHDVYGLVVGKSH